MFVPFVLEVVWFCANAGAESSDRRSTSAKRNRREGEVVGAIVLGGERLRLTEATCTFGWRGARSECMS